jgi:PIN domain nuclease of toxin-antitoxin system
VITLLDTHVLLWWLEARSRLRKSQEEVIERAGGEHTLLVSGISLWEIAALTELGRIRLQLPLREWLDRATAPPLVERVGISPAVAAEVAALPPQSHRDPADRIIVATARVHGATLLTCDRRIIASGLVPAIS